MTSCRAVVQKEEEEEEEREALQMHENKSNIVHAI